MADLKKLKEPTKASAFCKKHPKHRQSPGVCSLCLTEKLSKLGSSSSSGRSSRRSSSTMADSSSTSSSSLSYASSYYSSSASSPPLHGSRHLNTTTLLRGKTKLTKSRSSMPFFPRFREKGEGDEKNTKGGIWSKLIGRRSRRKQTKESLKHRKTVIERTSDIIVAH